jgi:hypothetical protein
MLAHFSTVAIYFWILATSGIFWSVKYCSNCVQPELVDSDFFGLSASFDLSEVLPLACKPAITYFSASISYLQACKEVSSWSTL